MSLVTEATNSEPTMTEEPVVLCEDMDGVATLTLNRPRHFNALSEAMLITLQTELGSIY
jgi:enoyl-CoA hydratase/carnithine racemase